MPWNGLIPHPLRVLISAQSDHVLTKTLGEVRCVHTWGWHESPSLLFCLTAEMEPLSAHRIFCPPTGIHAIGSPGSQALECGLKDTTGFPGPPACRQPTVGLLGLHYQVSQFLPRQAAAWSWFCLLFCFFSHQDLWCSWLVLLSDWRRLLRALEVFTR